jgi:hypothetical protein
MNNEQNVGSGDKILDWSIILSAILTYVKTADVFAYYSPIALTAIIGFDVSYIYGMASALIIEGVMLALHFNRNAHGYPPAEIAKWILLGISFLCQVFDGFITTNTLAQQSDELKFVFQYLVPGLPILVLLLVFAIRRLPNQRQGTSGSWRGAKNFLPSLQRFWHGDGEGNASPNASFASDASSNASPAPDANQDASQNASFASNASPDATDDQDANDTVQTDASFWPDASLATQQLVSAPVIMSKVPKGKSWPAVKNKLQKTDLVFIINGDEDDIMKRYGIRRRSVPNWRRYASFELERRDNLK